MSNDQELLELAAKAAGMQLDTYYLGRPEFSNGLILARGQTYPNKGSTVWNPLADDGDALRLAVKLGLVINCESGNVRQYERRNPILFVEIAHKSFDITAATRFAIVRAAAEIGKAMPTAPEERS